MNTGDVAIGDLDSDGGDSLSAGVVDCQEYRGLVAKTLVGSIAEH